MRLFSIAVLSVALHVTAVAQRPAKHYTIEEFLDTEQVMGASFSPDGSKVLVTSNRTGVLNAFALPVDGSPAIQLTHSTTESIVARSFFPNDERFLYEADQGGNELTHLYVQEVDGTVTDLTPGERLKASFAGWADDRRSFFVASNERNPQYFDFYDITVDGYERTLMYENNDGLDVQAVSADKRYLALGKENTNQDSDVFILDRNTGETRVLLNPSEPSRCAAEAFSKDGKSVFCLTNRGGEFTYLAKLPLAGGNPQIIEREQWDITYAEFSRSGKFMIVGINRDARTELRVYDSTTGDRIELPKLADMNISGVAASMDDKAIAFYVEGGRTPGDLYYHVLGSSTRPIQLTKRLNPAIDRDDLVEPQVVRFASYDGVQIPGILYKPLQATADNPVAALVWVHGGPGGQTRADWNPFIQYLVNHGYAVYGINNRGSSGYGKTFYSMDDQKHGEADLDDCVASKQMLIDTAWVDADRIGIIGGSYGGYMVCAALAFRPGQFRVGVDIFGVTNWVRTLKSIPPWWESGRKSLYLEMGDPATQEDYLTAISPLFHAENIKDPMIVLQGKNDPRVLQVESDEMVAAARKNDVPVEYIVFPDEGHGFRKKANQVTGYKAVLQFLDTHLAEK